MPVVSVHTTDDRTNDMEHLLYGNKRRVRHYSKVKLNFSQGEEILIGDCRLPIMLQFLEVFYLL